MHTAATITDVHTILTNSGLHPSSGYSWGDDMTQEQIQEIENKVCKWIWENAEFKQGVAEFDSELIQKAIEKFDLA